MFTFVSLIALSGLLHQAQAQPAEVNVAERALKNNCNRDDLYRSFLDPRYSASASSFCSTYIRPTVKATTTATATVTVTKGKRDLPATTSYPASRLSSACSCILTAAPSPTTVTSTVVTTVTTTKSSPTQCSVPTPIVNNGGFENRILAPWQANTYDGQTFPEDELSYGIATPGYGGSKQRFFANDTLASSYNEIDLTQTLTVCPGAKYKFTAKYYLTDPGDQPSKMKRQLPPGTKQVYLTVLVDDKIIAASAQSDALGPPIVWKTFSTTFTAAADTALLKVEFTATDFLHVEWGLDDVVVVPA